MNARETFIDICSYHNPEGESGKQLRAIDQLLQDMTGYFERNVCGPAVPTANSMIERARALGYGDK